MPDKEVVDQSVQKIPVPEFHFRVEISGVGNISCKEVSGLDIEFDMIECSYRSGNVTLKEVIFKEDKKLWNWINMVNMSVIKRTSVTIVLSDESGGPVHSWNLINAWPKKHTEEGFKTDGNNVSMESIVLAHEGVTSM